MKRLFKVLLATALVAMLIPALASAAEYLKVGDFEAKQIGARVYVYENGKQIFRTNGDGDNGNLKDLFVVDNQALIIVQHYKKGLMILADSSPNSVIAAKHVGTFGQVDEVTKVDGDNTFRAYQDGARVIVHRNGKQIFRTNGDGDNGTLWGMFVVNGNPYVVVKHYKKGFMVLGDRDSGVISAVQVATISLK